MWSGRTRAAAFELAVYTINRHHQRDIREMSAAAKRIVEHDHVAGFERALCSTAAATDIGMEPRCTGMWSPMAMTWPRGIEDSAGIVAALFDIGRERSAAQGRAHLFGDRVVEVLEDFEFDGITHVEAKSVRQRSEVRGKKSDCRSESMNSVSCSMAFHFCNLTSDL